MVAYHACVRWLLVVLCGCNQIFDLRSTGVIDAPPQQFFDAPTDAPPACPPTGATPTYSRSLVQVITQNCTYYSASIRSRTAIGYCYDDEFKTGYFEGELDAPLERVRGDLGSTATVLVRSAMLDPQGETVFADLYDFTDDQNHRAFVGTWQRAPDGAWQRGPDTTIPTHAMLYGSWISSPTADAPRRILVRSATAANMDEYGEDAGTWTLVTSYTPSDLGITAITSAQLSPDGLRVLLRGRDPVRMLGGMFYADRASVDAPFSTARYLDTVPAPSQGTAYMTEDCARVYMPALGSLFYAAQR